MNTLVPPAMEARCLLVTRPGAVSLDRCLVPGPGANELLVETWYSCVSPGTESRILAGNQRELPANFYPLIPGYALVGRVIARGSGVATEYEGAVVACAGTARASYRLGWGGHVSHAVVAAASAPIVPATVDPMDAVFGPLAAIAWRGVRLARPVANETVAVLGLGLLGQLSARLFKSAGARVFAGGLHQSQVELATRGGVEAVPIERNAPERLRKMLGPGAAIVVDATGDPNALTHAVALAATKPWDSTSLGGARLVIQGSYTGELMFPHHAAFERELTVVWPRFFTAEDTRAVLEILATGNMRFRDLATAIVDAADAPRGYAELCTGPRSGRITTVIRWAANEGPVPAPESASPGNTSLQPTEKSGWWQRLRKR